MTTKESRSHATTTSAPTTGSGTDLQGIPSQAPRHRPGQFASVDLCTHDLDAAVSFYSGLFGWGLHLQDTVDDLRYGLFTSDGADVAGIGEMSGEMRAAGAPAVWNSYVLVDDVAAAADRAVALGATLLVEPMQVLDYGHLAFMTDPAGASFGLWQAGSFTGADRVDVPGSFCWNELATSDLDASLSFYGDLFGWTFAAHSDANGPYRIILNDGAQAGGIMPLGAETRAPSHWSVYFAVEDADASASRVQVLGGQVHHGPFDTPVGRIAIAADPHGAPFNLIALTETP